MTDPQDTIVAPATPPGPGNRAIIRISGPDALTVARSVFSPADALPELSHRFWVGQLHLPDGGAALPADAYVWRGPRTPTGQDMVELHTLACPPLIDLVLAQLLTAGARAAQPGEFTLRAFLAGKLDLTQAEAVLGIIEAGDRDELRHALVQLAGGVARPLQELRDDLLNLLADVEAGLDFADEDVQFIAPDELLHRLTRGLAQVTLLQKQLGQRALRGRPFRVVLTGQPNVGKSSLFNALTGATNALVSAEPGTTRDYLIGTMTFDDVALELIDTAGRQEAKNVIEDQAQGFGREQAEHADLLLLCVAAGRPMDAADCPALQDNVGRPMSYSPQGELAQARSASEVPVPRWRFGLVSDYPALRIVVNTKCDLGPALADGPATSVVTGAGLEELREQLRDRAKAQRQAGLASSLSRCRHHVDVCLEHLRRAHGAVLFSEPSEVLALELRGALDQLGEMVGAVYTDDLLDRIFSRFCIGK